MKNQNLACQLGPNLPGRRAAVCAIGAAGYGLAAACLPQMALPLGVVGGYLATKSALGIREALVKMRFESAMLGKRRQWMTHDEFAQLAVQAAGVESRWLGYGFSWDAEHCQSTVDFLKQDWRELYRQAVTNTAKLHYVKGHFADCLLHPLTSLNILRTMKDVVSTQPGYAWIHAMGEEKSLLLPSKNFEGHAAVFGTTGAGKSRFLELMIHQAILMGYTVIVIDPKGDKGLVKTTRAACIRAGRQSDYLYFHPGHPEESINLNLLANSTRTDEIASRIADSLPGQGGDSQPFIDMGRGALRTICVGLAILGRKPTFRNLHYFFANRRELAEQVLYQVLTKTYGVDVIEEALSGKKSASRLETLIVFYQSRRMVTPELESIIALAERDEDSFSKTTQSTWLLLTALASGDLGKKLSPSEDDDKKPFYDTRKIIEQRGVFYLGLDALTDSGMARAIGSMMLADLASTAGARYDFETAPAPVMLFVDEAAELTCEPLTQMLNKSRGANFSICLASQTISDFVAKAKDRAEALRILANLNNFFALRCNDPETQRFLMERIPKTRIRTTVKAHGVSTSARNLIAEGGSVSERVTEEEADLVPAPLLSALPNCEYFGVVAGGHVIKGRIPILVETAQEFKEGA